MPLAINSYKSVEALADGAGTLNLAWTHDERRLLSVDIDSIIARELEDESRHGLEYVNRYLVKDPYGEDALGSSVAGFFGRSHRQGTVTCGAGVASVLHALARLPDERAVCVIGDSYPDFPCWAERSGRRCLALNPLADAEDHARSVSAADASLLVIERPGLISDRFADLSQLAFLCELAARSGAFVLLDESNANYRPPAYSAVNLVDAATNLVVVRGLSKAYGLGGLRLSYCVASGAATDRIRSLIPPLLSSSLSLRIGMKILQLGDIAAPLRERIGEAKRDMADLFRRGGLEGVVPSSEGLPYLFLERDREYIRTRLGEHGVVGKLHPLWPGRHIYRLSAPLEVARMDTLRQKLSAAWELGLD
jgi:histidinol-phosphate/aromatic aminotransferase/cobyric acid decarboxylase-like protein